LRFLLVGHVAEESIIDKSLTLRDFLLGLRKDENRQRLGGAVWRTLRATGYFGYVATQKRLQPIPKTRFFA
jgi:hypothetical protein